MRDGAGGGETRGTGRGGAGGGAPGVLGGGVGVVGAAVEGGFEVDGGGEGAVGVVGADSGRDVVDGAGWVGAAEVVLGAGAVAGGFGAVAGGVVGAVAGGVVGAVAGGADGFATGGVVGAGAGGAVGAGVVGGGVGVVGVAAGAEGCDVEGASCFGGEVAWEPGAGRSSGLAAAGPVAAAGLSRGLAQFEHHRASARLAVPHEGHRTGRSGAPEG